MKTAVLSLATLVLATVLASTALADQERVNDFKSQFRKLRVTELPREAARAVTANPAAASDVVTAAVEANGTSAPLIVGSVAKAAPQHAAASARAAVALQPKLSGAIAKAAVSAAPSEVAEIVSAMCQVHPTSFYTVGVSAGEAAPKSSDKIVGAITEAVPGLKPIITRAQADFAKAKRTASLALLLKHADNLVAALSRDMNKAPGAVLAEQDSAVSMMLASAVSMKLATATLDIPPPVPGPPFVPGGGTPGEITTGNTVEVPPTGRTYSAP